VLGRKQNGEGKKKNGKGRKKKLCANLSMETRLDTHKWRAAVSSEMGGWAVGKPKAAKNRVAGVESSTPSSAF